MSRAVWSVNPNLPLASVRTLEAVVSASTARTSFTLVILAIAGAMALLLGVAGIYGVISYAVSQRTREIGIRMALGAERQEVTRMFVRYGLGLAAIGIARARCGNRADAADGVAALRGESDRLADVRRRVSEPGCRSGAGELRAGVARDDGEPGDGAASS